MTITLNGQAREFEAETLTVLEMVAELGLSGHPVLVELNGEALLRKEFEGNSVTDGATVEIVRMVAGG